MAKNRKLTICGIPFDIVEQDKFNGADDIMGLCDIAQSKLFIASGMPQATKDATLVHEWIHAVLQHSGIDHEEVLVSVLANELYREGFRVKVQ